VSATNVTLLQVFGAVALVAVAVAISLWERARLETDIAVAVLRSFVQLTAVGFVIAIVFEEDSLWLVAAMLTAMVVIAAFTARGRARDVPEAFPPLLLSLALAATVTVGLVVAIGIFPAEPRYIVPIGGMVIGNAMTAAAVALNRLGEDVRDSRGRIEASLALGATSTQAIRPVVRRALRSGMIPVIDQTKSTGIVAFPGTMVGMLLAGADPVDAVRLQLILLYLLMGGTAVAALTATALARRRFFTPAHQLRELPRRA
jgi:putative ABC transport system permease protein